MGTCNAEWKERLSAWTDGEVDAHERVLMEGHLRACDGCRHDAEAYGSLRAALKADAAAEPTDSASLRDRVAGLTSPREQGLDSASLRDRVAGLASPHGQVVAPASLRERVAALLSPSDGVATPASIRESGSAVAPPRHRGGRRTLFAGFGAAAAALLVLWTAWPSGFNEALAMELERHHLKAFSRSEPCEFVSEDPSAVKEWVAREVGYEVEVPVIPGATLLGARRCRLHGHLTASLLYRYRGRAITLFVPPADSRAGREIASFAEEGARCTQGPVGEWICMSSSDGERVTVAVSELESPQLLSVLAQP